MLFSDCQCVYTLGLPITPKQIKNFKLTKTFTAYKSMIRDTSI